MIIDTTQSRVAQCRDKLLKFISFINGISPNPCKGLNRTVVCIPGMLTSVFVKCWEDQTGLKFDWDRVIHGDAPSLVMAELELESNTENISDQLTWCMEMDLSKLPRESDED